MTSVRTGVALLIAAGVAACSAPGSYQPTVGQAGKDVVWVPTPQSVVDRMLDLAKVTPQDYVLDLGSGDGRTVISAAKRGARAHGIEFNADLVELSRRNAAAAGVTGRASFERADLFQSDFSKATVVTLFLLPRINLQLRPKLLELAPGTRVVSNTFDMGEWTADETERVAGGCSAWCTAYLWIVPARVAGTWKMPEGELTLRQEFQMLSGTLRTDRGPLAVDAGKVRGTEIVFRAGGTVYRGSVDGERLDLATGDGRRIAAQAFRM